MFAEYRPQRTVLRPPSPAQLLPSSHSGRLAHRQESNRTFAAHKCLLSCPASAPEELAGMSHRERDSPNRPAKSCQEHFAEIPYISFLPPEQPKFCLCP